MKTKILLLLILIGSLNQHIHAYDFAALNKDNILIYYNFNEDGNTVMVTYKHAPYPVPTGTSTDNDDDWYFGDITIPESVEYANQTFPVTAIGDSAFYYRYNLINIIIPESVTTIGDQAFSVCDKLKDIYLYDNVVSIGYAAFAGCLEAKNIRIGENVTTIGSYAFNGCTSVTSITIPSKVISIGTGAFSYCPELKEFIVSEQNINYSTMDGVLVNKDKTKLIAYPNKKSSTYTIPNTISTIGIEAFWRCELDEITISESVTVIEEAAFHGTKLSSLIIPDQVTAIGNYAFAACLELKKVTIFAHNVLFGDNVFYWDERLEEIHNLSAVPQTIGRFSFTFVDKNLCKLYVPAGSLEAYQTADVWSSFEHIIEETYESIASINEEYISIHSIKGGISVVCNGRVQVKIFSITGQNEIYHSAVFGHKKIFLQQGAYIVCIGNKNKKILVSN